MPFPATRSRANGRYFSELSGRLGLREMLRSFKDRDAKSRRRPEESFARQDTLYRYDPSPSRR